MADDDSHLAAGLDLLLSAKLEECEAYFSPAAAPSGPARVRSAHNARCAFGLALVSVIRALVSFEQEDVAMGERRLATVIQLALPSWSQSLSPSFLAPAPSLESLDLELVGADALLFSAVLHFMSESSLDYLKGALAIRRAHKMYQRAETELQRRGISYTPQSMSPPSNAPGVDVVVENGDAYFDAAPVLESLPTLVRRGTKVEDRVKGAASLGVGLYSLVFSFIPPRIQPVAASMGFGSTGYSRQASLERLRACVQSGTARAPVASLVLLIFHSAMLIFARGVSDEADTKEAAAVLDMCLRQYPDSPLFRFFQGRLERGKSRIGFALDAYLFAQTKCGSVTAMHDLCSYERAFCLSLQGEYGSAAGLFASLARSSPWSPCFYGYLAASAYFSHAVLVVVRHVCDAQLSERDALQAAVDGRRPPLEEARIALLSAARWYNVVPTTVQKRHGRTIPPEAFAESRARAFNERLDALFGESWEEALKSSATWAQLTSLACSLCLPTLEVAYFWNGYFQMSRSGRESCLELMSKTATMVRTDPEAWKAHEALLHLMRAAMLRENARYKDAESELDYFTGKPDSLWQTHFARFERGLCRYLQGDFKGASQAMASVGDSGHFFDSRLKFRLRSATNMIEAKQ